MLFRIHIGQKPRRLEKSIILLHTKQVRPRSNPMSRRKHVTLLFNIFSIETDGFIHATHDAKLLIDVLNHFYQDIDDTFICLEIDTTKLDSEVKMESPAPVRVSLITPTKKNYTHTHTHTHLNNAGRREKSKRTGGRTEIPTHIRSYQTALMRHETNESGT